MKDLFKLPKPFWWLSFSYFVVLFNYPLVRASTTTIFFEALGAKSTPIGWFLSILFLIITISTNNKIQARVGVHKLFFYFSLFTTFLMLLGCISFSIFPKFFSYTLFIWKEIYIVVQIHLLLAYTNVWLAKDDFKKAIGLIGAIGSIGGMIGGVVTSYASQAYGTHSVLYLSLIFLLIPALIFFKTPKIHSQISASEHKSPLASLDTKELKTYVFLLCLIVALTQFIINIADFQFNLVFEKNITDSSMRTAYLGKLYSLTNLVTFVLQFVFLPILLKKLTARSIHLLIPLSYFFSLGLGLSLGNHLLLTAAGFYLFLKAADYSIFSAAKELLYQPLQPLQKYGAKYLSDMLVYRISKALIAAVLIYIQTPSILNVLMCCFLTLWVLALFKLFRLN